MDAAARPLPERIVLVVDDEPMVCRLTARTLSEAGFRVLEAHDAAEALQLLDALDPTVVGLIVSDITLPGMTGDVLAATVMERWPDLPVILVSGQGGPKPGYPGLFLAKPFTPETLVSAAEAVLRGSPAKH